MIVRCHYKSLRIEMDSKYHLLKYVISWTIKLHNTCSMMSWKEQWTRNKETWILFLLYKRLRVRLWAKWFNLFEPHLSLVLPSFPALSISKLHSDDFLYSYQSLIQYGNSQGPGLRSVCLPFTAPFPFTKDLLSLFPQRTSGYEHNLDSTWKGLLGF